MQEQLSRPDLTLIDGYGYIFRAFYALPSMTRADGVPVNAVYGFCRMLAALLRSPHLRSDGSCACAVVFDAPGKTFRHRLYPAYKAHRKDTPPDLLPQFAIMRDAARAFSLASLEVADYEADDVIASYTRAARERGWSVEIYSGDKDLMQLIAPDVRLRDPMKGLVLGEEAVLKRFGVSSDKILDVMALAGDASDNIPGVPGIGVKTAADLLARFSGLEALLRSIEQVAQPRRRALLEEYGEQARLSRRLATLCDRVPLPLPLEALRRRPSDPETLRAFFLEQNFASLARDLDSPQQRSSAHSSLRPAEPPPPTLLETPSALVLALETLAQNAQCAFYPLLEEAPSSSSSRSPRLAPRLIGLALASPTSAPLYVPITEKISSTLALQALKPLLEDRSVLKIGYDLKQACLLLQEEGIEARALDDVMLLSYVLEAGKHEHALEALSLRDLQRKLQSREQLLGKGRNKRMLRDLAQEEAAAYACAAATALLDLREELARRLSKERSKALYETLDRPLIPVLARMQRLGLGVDCAALQRLTETYRARLHVLEEEIFVIADERFLLASPKQLGEVLFGRLQLGKGKKTATGQFSTHADVLEPLAGQHRIAALVLRWRHFAKLISTYTEALPRAAHNGRIHTTFSMIGAQTGRLASSHPNLQNIPVRDAEGKDIRRCFIAAPGEKLITLDYSQIELRLIASIAGVKRMCAAFGESADIHRATAAEIFDLAPAAVTVEQRRQAKAINFGILYGMSRFGLARQLSIGEHEAQRFIDLYLYRYPELLTYRTAVVLFCKTKGYVETLMGRRIHLAGITAKNQHVRAHAERQAINAPIQGTAADIVKQAMVRVARAIGKGEIAARLLLQVHDELLLEAPAARAEESARKVQALMQTAAQPQMALSVDLEVSYRIGDNWTMA